MRQRSTGQTNVCYKCNKIIYLCKYFILMIEICFKKFGYLSYYQKAFLQINNRYFIKENAKKVLDQGSRNTMNTITPKRPNISASTATRHYLGRLLDSACLSTDELQINHNSQVLYFRFFIISIDKFSTANHEATSFNHLVSL